MDVNQGQHEVKSSHSDFSAKCNDIASNLASTWKKMPVVPQQPANPPVNLKCASLNRALVTWGGPLWDWSVYSLVRSTYKCISHRVSLSNSPLYFTLDLIYMWSLYIVHFQSVCLKGPHLRTLYLRSELCISDNFFIFVPSPKLYFCD